MFVHYTGAVQKRWLSNVRWSLRHIFIKSVSYVSIKQTLMYI